MKTFQIVIEGTVPGDGEKQILEAAESLRSIAGQFAENLAGGGSVRRAGLSIANAPGHHAADSQYFDLLAKAEEAAPVAESEAPAGETPLAAAETAAPPTAPPAPAGVTGDVTTGPEVTS